MTATKLIGHVWSSWDLAGGYVQDEE
jgi:hypothetical protein